MSVATICDWCGKPLGEEAGGRRRRHRACAPRANRAVARERSRMKQAALVRERQREKKQATRQRNCLCCGHPFTSEGKHHRICDPCKETSEYQHGVRDECRVILPQFEESVVSFHF
jgi:hypothetical protein